MTDQLDDTAFRRQCAADYTAAEITVVAHTAPKAQSFTNLLAVVEFLHAGLEANPLIARSSKNGGFPRNIELGRRAGKLHVHKFALPVDEALAWYRGCLKGAMSVPGTSAPTVVQLPKFDEDPPWPHHVVETHDFWEESPFWGERPGGSRWHRLIPVNGVEITDDWNARDFEKAGEWLHEHLHVDLLSRSVVLGSCHLCLPNPLYRGLSTRVAESWRAIEVHLLPYPGADVSTLELTYWNRRPWGATSVIRVPLSAGVTLVEVPDGVEEVAHAVTCAKRGLLEQSEPAGFLSSIHVGLQLASEQRTVVVPRPGALGEETYSVGVARPAEPIVIGEPRRGQALPRLAADESRRSAAELWGRLQVQWFDGNATAGRQAVRSIIRRATKTVDLLDPYFSKNDLLGFPLATSVHGQAWRRLSEVWRA